MKFVVKGKNVYNEFLPEAGGHRFQRVPPTEKRGRRHTSTITVAVLPETTVYMGEPYRLDNTTLEWEFFRSSGPGGQNVNKLETGVRVRHIPSGMTVVCQDERSRRQNQKKALQILHQRFAEKIKKDSLNNKNKDRKEQVGSGQRGDKIRTYREQDDKVKNHLNGKKVRYSDILSGNIDKLR